MAKTQIFSLPDKPAFGLLAPPGDNEGFVRAGTLRPSGKLDVGACWQLFAVPDGYDIFVDQRRGKVLTFTHDRRVTYESIMDEGVLERAKAQVQWDAETGDLAYIVPKLHPTLALMSNGENQPIGLDARSKKAANCRWKIDFAPQPASAPLPRYDDRAVDETYYNLRAAYADNCFLTLRDEQALGAEVVFGNDPRSAKAQFRIMPLPGGARVAERRILTTVGEDANARLAIVDQPANQTYRPMPLINLNGSRRFCNGDRVALRSRHQRYLGLAASGSDVVAQRWSPRAEDVFILQRVSGKGGVGAEDRFTLQASNGRYLKEESDHGVRASATTAAAATAFLLDPRQDNAFAIVGRNSGHPLQLGPVESGVRHLQQAFVSGSNEPFGFVFEPADNNPNVFRLRCGSSSRDGFIATLVPEGVAVRDPRPDRSPAVGFITFGVPVAGISFVLQEAPTQAWPDTPDLTLEAYRDPAEDYTRLISSNLAQGAGSLASYLLEVPGGASVFSFVFNKIWPQQETSTYDLFSRFRADILNDVRRLIASNAVFQAQGAMRIAHNQYLVDYLNSRRDSINTNVSAPRNSIVLVASQFGQSLAFLALERGENGAIKDTPQNAELVAAGLPVYVLLAMEYMNALQEAALLHAFDPANVLPDIYLKLHNGEYMLGDPKKGVIGGAAKQPLTEAVRVLNRGGSATLHHGDTVLLRTPSGQNVTAAEGGGGALVATAPANHVGGWEIFTVVKIGATAAGTPIANGDAIALQPERKNFYLQAQGGGQPVNAAAPHAASWETFRVDIHRDEALRPDPQLLTATPAYEQHVENLRQHARDAYKEIQRMYAFLVADRQSAAKYVYVDQYQDTLKVYNDITKSWSFNNRYALSFRDKRYNWNIDRVMREWGDKPAGWDDFANHAPLNQAMDQYRQNLAHTYFHFKYRYYEAAQRLETFADETLDMCRRLASDPLAATAFSYAARTTPYHAL